MSMNWMNTDTNALISDVVKNENKYEYKTRTDSWNMAVYRHPYIVKICSW